MSEFRTPFSRLNRRFTTWLNPRGNAERIIAEKYASLNGAPGAKVGDLGVAKQGGGGFVQRYANGAIYWRRDLAAYWVRGTIYEKFTALGGAAGFLGQPVTDETRTPDGVGHFTHFEGGSIYWHPSIGAREIHGAIRECWKQLGWERYGYPITDETPTEPGRGRYSHFRRFNSDGTVTERSIYWSPASGAHAVDGAIRARWFELGEGRSYLGFPTTGEMDWTDPDTQQRGRISHFERGAIGLTTDDGRTVEFPARRVFRSGHIGVSSVGGWVELTLTSAGTFHFKGHLHNSGFVGLNCTVGSAIKIPGTNQAIGVKHEVNVGGTTSIDSRDEDWNEDGFKYEVRANWNSLMNASAMRTTIKTELGGWEVLTLVLLPLLGAAVLISLVSGPSAPDTHCETTKGWHTVKDLNNRTVIEPDGVRCRRR
jgi:hypothetical protein